jgi:hypothetical protein
MKLARLVSYGLLGLATSSFLGQVASVIPFFQSLVWILFWILLSIAIAVLFAGDAFDAWFGFEMRWSFAIVFGLLVLCIVGGLLGWIVIAA